MSQTSELLYPYAAIGTEVAVLFDIKKPTKNIAIFQREISPLKNELARVMINSVEFKKGGTFEEIRSALEQYFKDHLENYPHLLNDILEQLNLFKDLSGGESFKILFSTIKTNMCRRFHTDINALRLLCTYAGPGTMWLPDEIVNHKAFLSRGGNKQIVLDESQIQQVATGDVIILKGALFPNANPIVHRSPTIETNGENRLLLRIDTNDSINL